MNKILTPEAEPCSLLYPIRIGKKNQRNQHFLEVNIFLRGMLHGWWSEMVMAKDLPFRCQPGQMGKARVKSFS